MFEPMTVGAILQHKAARLGSKITVTDSDVQWCIDRLADGHGMNFQVKENRDYVYKIAKDIPGIPKMHRHSIRNQLLDPRYTVEGRLIPDKGLANDYRHHHAVIYCIDPERIW